MDQPFGMSFNQGENAERVPFFRRGKEGIRYFSERGERDGKVLKVSALRRNLPERLSLVHPAENLFLVGFNFFGTKQNGLRQIVRYDHDSVDIADHHVPRTNNDITDFNGDLIVSNQTTSERAIGYAVLVEDGKIFLEDLVS